MNAVQQLIQAAQARQLPLPEERKRIREAAGITIREAAVALKVPRMTFWRWEKGDVQPRLAQRAAYRQLLDGLKSVIEKP